jgi:ABC-type cobalamin/Fe3+-siderophores transport system ATPase subunit
MIKDGRVLASGPVEQVLTAGRVRDLYDVDVDVVRHGNVPLVAPRDQGDTERRT